MKNIFNKYFDFIGVEQEGLRRIILLIIVGWYLFCFSIIFDDGLSHYRYRVPIGQDGISKIVLDTYRLFFHQTIMFFGIPITFSVGIKIINWIIDGFKQSKSSNE